MTWQENFMSEIIKNSDAETYDLAKEEWVSYGESFIESDNHCICGHWIRENCIIVNTENGDELVVGNCCIKKFKVVKEHYNKTRLNYINLCLLKCKHNNDTIYCEIVKEEIEKGAMFNYKQLEYLEAISKVKPRFKPNKNIEDACYSKSNSFCLKIINWFESIKSDIILKKEKNNGKKFYTIKGLMNRHNK